MPADAHQQGGKIIMSRDAPATHRLRRRSVLAIVAVITSFVFTVAHAAAPAAATTPAATTTPAAPAATTTSAPRVRDGAALYHHYCSVCHGEQGNGRSRAQHSLVPPPLDFTAPAQAQRLTRDYMLAIVRDGKPGTAMVGWRTQLRDDEMQAIVDHVERQFVRRTAAAPPPAHPAPARADMTLPLPRGLSGNATRGAAFYARNCATCHGERGDGAGPRAYFIKPKPRNFLDAPARAMLNRPALYAAIAKGRIGTEMPAWDTVIDEQQIADVAEYVYTAFIRPQPLARRQP